MFKVELSRRADKELELVFRADRTLHQRFMAALEGLERDPWQGKMLRGKYRGSRSYRLGSYRILYEIRQRQLIVFVIDLGHRRAIYE